MSTIRLATAANVLGFQNLVTALNKGGTEYILDHEALQDEIGRFRVWCGNIGVLQKGHSSLDYRLRDSPLLSSNVLKLLAELKDNIEAAVEIVSGTRLPYEKQQKPEDANDEDNNDDDDFFSEDEDEDDDQGPKTELEMRFCEIVDIINNLYKLSVRIRQPTVRSRALKASAYAPKDPETGIDIMEKYATFDLQHTKELVSHLRTPYMSADDTLQDDNGLVDRLACAITLRRRHFKYWKRHRDKLGNPITSEEISFQPNTNLVDVSHNAPLDVSDGLPAPLPMKPAASQKTGKTLLSATEATHHHQSLDDIVDSKSVTSYATTVRDASGRTIQLPPPPKEADGEKDFECPLCYIMCPSRYANQRSWRTHVLQDLQPYVCTYKDCETPNQLYQSRRHWAEHEAGHRRVWRCPEHPDAVFKSEAGLGNHLRQNHGESFSENQLDNIVKVGQTSTLDLRTCPICCAPAESDDIVNHIANHLERLAAFALPTNSHEESDTGSSQASRGGTDSTGSQDLSGITFDNEYQDAVSSEKVEPLTARDITSWDGTKDEAAEVVVNRDSNADHALSAERLSELPNATQDRLDMLLSRQPDVSDGDDPQTPHDAPLVDEEHQVDIGSHGQRTGPLPQILEATDLPTLRSLYKSRVLRPQESQSPSFQPNDHFNQIIAFCKYDITRLRVDAIVNSANRSLEISRASFTLNNYIHNTAGPQMDVACKVLPKMNTGQAVMTGGFNLPCAHVIHASRPNYIGNVPAGNRNSHKNLLAECYHNALQLAMNHGLQTVAFPSIGSGGCGFPPSISARIAVSEVHKFLDEHPAHIFKTVIFCVYTRADEIAYEQILPVYFPPTQEDLQSVITDKPAISNAVLTDQVQETFSQIEKVHKELVEFGQHMPSSPRIVLDEFVRIAQALRSLKSFIAGEKSNAPGILSNKTVEHFNLTCQVMQHLVGSVTEIVELAKGKAALGQPSYQLIWDDYNSYIKSTQGFDLAKLLQTCGDFVQCLESVVLRNEDEPYEMNTMSIRLGSWLIKTTGRGSKGVRDHFEEIMYTRAFQRDVPASGQTEVVKLHQIPSVSRLYQLGELEQTATYSTASARFNDIVCLYRGDMTQIAVDVMVNSTDPNFEGMGQLDRTVFKKAGIEMQREVSDFIDCEEGDIKVTGGYQLPCKHVLHAVPPEAYQKDSKDVLRKIYREILHKASSLKATSIALPAIGTGSLNYPARNCAAIAIEEVKRFLESTDVSGLVEKIIFCVFGSNDEFIYKSLLSVYLPPANANFDNALSGAHTTPLTGTASSSPSSRRLPSKEEEIALGEFERHAETCLICIDVARVYREGGSLCEDGYAAAQSLLQHLYMEADKTVFSTTVDQDTNTRVQVEIPSNFSLSYELLTTVEKSFRKEGNTRPFVSPNQPFPSLAGYQKDNKEPTSPTILGKSEKAFAHIFIWSDVMNFWRSIQPDEASIHIHPGRIRAFAKEHRSEFQRPLLSLDLTPGVRIEKPKSTEVIIGSTDNLDEWDSSNTGKVLLQFETPAECEMLFQHVKNAAKREEADTERMDDKEDAETPKSDTEEVDIGRASPHPGPELQPSPDDEHKPSVSQSIEYINPIHPRFLEYMMDRDEVPKKKSGVLAEMLEAKRKETERKELKRIASLAATKAAAKAKTKSEEEYPDKSEKLEPGGDEEKADDSGAFSSKVGSDVPLSGKPVDYSKYSSTKTVVRSNIGCRTCRKRKKKCDQTKPFCLVCEKNNIHCEGYGKPVEIQENSKDKSDDSGAFPSKMSSDVPVSSETVDDSKYFSYVDAAGPEADVAGNTWTKLNRGYISYMAVKEMGLFVAGEDAESITVATKLDLGAVVELVQKTAERRAKRSSLPSQTQRQSSSPTNRPSQEEGVPRLIAPRQPQEAPTNHPPPFVFQIDEIRQSPDIPPQYDSAGSWRPLPTIGGHRRVTVGTTGLTWMCTGNQIIQIGDIPLGSQPYKSFSLYYSAGIFVLPLDVTANTKDNWESWKYLTFEHSYDYSSGLTHAGSERRLRVQRIDQRWPALLLPDIYHAQTRSSYTQYGGLKGELAILLGLYALSVSASWVPHVLSRCFRDGAWQTSHDAHPREEQRGVVVRIYTCPHLQNTSSGSTKVDLAAYEEGHWGPYLK